MNLCEQGKLILQDEVLNDPILHGGLENADLFPMSVRRTVVYSYSKKMLYGGDKHL
jgi:hypothetical protein